MFKSRWPKSWELTIEHLWLAAPFFVIFFKGLRAPLPLLDFWWHLKMGEIIIGTRSIPHTDLLSYTAADQPFIVHNWLAEIAYYGTYWIGGLPLLMLLNAVTLSIALLLVFLLCRESTNRTKMAVLSVFLVCLAFPINARPQVFSFALFALFYWILDGYRFRRRDRLWLLPLIMVVWTNVHGAFVIGLGLIAVFLVSESIRCQGASEAKETLSLRPLLKLWLVFAACIVATLLNPETYRVYEYIHIVLSDRASQQLVMEWQPPQVDTLLGFQMFFGLFGLAILGFTYSNRRANLTDLTLFLAFSVLALTALRNTIWFAIIIAPILARYWAELDLRGFLRIPNLTGFGDSSFKENTTGVHSPKSRSGMNLIVVFVAFFALVLSSPWIRQIQNENDLVEPQTPVSAVDYIEKHKLRDHIFHPQIFGDYLLWRLYPQQRSFIDGRVHLFGESFVRKYQRIFHDSQWEEKLASFDIKYLLLSKDSGQADSLELIQKARESDNWSVLFEDDISIFFTRAKS